MAAQFASEIEAMEIGFSLRQGFGMDLNLSAKNESTVQFLAGLLGSQLQLAATQSKDAQTADLLKKLSVSAQGKRLNLSLRLSEEEFERNIKALQSARMTPFGSAAPASAPARTASPSGDVSIFPPPANKSSQSRPQAQPEPEGPRKIRIFGLEGGVKEIPLDSNGNGR